MTPRDCIICAQHSKSPDSIITGSEGILVRHYPVTNGAPANRGHLLIEPIRHIHDISEMNKAEAESFGRTIVRVSSALKKATEAEHVYLFRINDQVAHLHFHLIPRYPGTPREFWGLKILDWANFPKVDSDGIKSLTTTLTKESNPG